MQEHIYVGSKNCLELKKKRLFKTKYVGNLWTSQINLQDKLNYTHLCAASKPPSYLGILMNMLLNIVYLKRRSFANLLTLLHNWHKNMSVGLFSLVKGRGFPQKSFNCAWKLGGNNSTIESGFPAARTFGLVWFGLLCFVLFACLLDLVARSAVSLLGHFPSPFWFFFFDLSPLGWL